MCGLNTDHPATVSTFEIAGQFREGAPWPVLIKGSTKELQDFSTKELQDFCTHPIGQHCHTITSI